MKQSKQADLILESMPRKAINTRPIYGIGINDSVFCTAARLGGIGVNHRAYAAWKGMFKRCYCQTYQIEMRTYEGCSVGDGWHRFTDFFEWWKVNFVEGWHLDKDILVPGNKIYSKETCVYIPPELNFFVSMSVNRDDLHPIGAYKCSDSDKYFSKIRDRSGKSHHLGTFADAQDAHEAWIAAKLQSANSFKSVCNSIRPDLFNSLIAKIESMRSVRLSSVA